MGHRDEDKVLEPREVIPTLDGVTDLPEGFRQIACREGPEGVAAKDKGTDWRAEGVTTLRNVGSSKRSVKSRWTDS